MNLARAISTEAPARGRFRPAIPAMLFGVVAGALLIALTAQPVRSRAARPATPIAQRSPRPAAAAHPRPAGAAVHRRPPAPSSATSARGEIIRTGRIVVDGNAHTREGVILRAIPLRPGEPFDYGLLERARENLRRVVGIDYSEIRVQYQPDDSSLGLRVFVTEVPTLEGSAWVERGPEDDYSFGVALGDANFRGNGERIRVSARFWNNTSGTIRWENPWVSGGSHRFGVGVDAWYRSYRYAYGDFGGRFSGSRIRRGGLRAFVLLESPPRVRQPWERPGSLRPRGRAELFARVERLEGRVIPDAGFAGKNTEWSLGIHAIRDTRPSAAFPFAGYYLSGELVSIGSLDGSTPETVARFDVRRFFPLGNRFVAAGRLRATLRSGARFPYRREHTGGGNSLRGWNYGAFHGYSAAYTTGELRFPVNFTRDEPLEEVLLGIELHAFADVAAAWDTARNLSNDDVFGGYGVGLGLLNRQTRGLRVDWGFARGRRSRVHVEAGLSF